MPLSREELDRRLEVADRSRVALRRATRELELLGKQILRERTACTDDRPGRSDRGTAGR